MAAKRLTKAQQEALSVLAQVGSRVDGSKRKSTMEPRPNINVRAGTTLAHLGLARMIDPDIERGYTVDHGFQRGIVCSYKFEITRSGIAVFEGGKDE